ncbi:amidohydrolase family protein [Mycolicibacterium hassiacum DSM 44199]|jgi:N-acyl-D-aspartate/D-glutamate deacylase|uniref:Amidohydrolase family protein n=1 Tax=Mycolicibacterium hassiacum (strain DSM 44199 / CIP 105218 / JCM 12690 / 3849) TaxID=1122247 RepID=K5BA27_MYCHD|nr:amidohydrolase family protein [Mycolicibacterium hassiacum]EKF21510.1 amidohydrolase family protein [Mycolicibacterium hassiacum DSM 44199]MBX5487430.1 amidohydrolase family protein [Mycolicibacterium hassiacum]MDA4088618.1 amidohydrolase [Mycolicibacterium hassiacum DSM 44199]PZN25470.1 MAG: amidohydrolase [Mycolicibacterium hassiacum]VCT90158.1 D-aminoacylase [Mycolicibacterium hassiacum DSM 44199]
MLDLKIVGGTVVDGTGAERYPADIGVLDGRIVEVRRRGPGDPGLTVEAAETIDATGRIVTPGFVDIHTHYDGQVSWDELLEPSSLHGVTTVVSGNCGVGFAPVIPGREQWLIELMEGVEDIPGTALAEGIIWQWESFPEYLDAIEKRPLAIDYGTQIAHGAVRGYAMGDRGARNEDATDEDIAVMARLVREAIEAGALGFSTSRTEGHRAVDGEPVPGTYAAERELFGIGRAMAAAGRAVFEVAPQGAAGDGTPEDALAELEWMVRLADEIDRPVSYAMVQCAGAPWLYREQLERTGAARDRGVQICAQFAARPFGMLFGFPGYHAFTHRPTYRRLQAELDRDELAVRLADPAVRQAILSEEDLPPQPFPLYDGMYALIQHSLDRIYPIGDPPDYEPTPDRTVAAIAAQRGEDPLATLYDLMLEHDASALVMLPFFNYVDGNHDAIHEMITHPAAVSGLSDGGAHCGLICDASYPTYLLTHWARDRRRGPRLPLEYVVRRQTRDTATLYGLSDRGVIAVGKKADLNVIDFDALQLDLPRMVYDLPAGGRRLIQGATGYDATIVSGVVVRRHGADTGARPGRLVRGTR